MLHDICSPLTDRRPVTYILANKLDISNTWICTKKKKRTLHLKNEYIVWHPVIIFDLVLQWNGKCHWIIHGIYWLNGHATHTCSCDSMTHCCRDTNDRWPALVMITTGYYMGQPHFTVDKSPMITFQCSLGTYLILITKISCQFDIVYATAISPKSQWVSRKFKETEFNAFKSNHPWTE